MPRTVPPRLPLTKHGGIRACAFHRMNPGRIQTELEPNSDRFPSESQTKPDRKLLAAPPRQVNADKLPDILAIWALFLYSIFVLRIVHADWSTLLKIVDSALKHGFSEDDLREIWNTVPEGSVVRVRHVKQPPHYMMLGDTSTDFFIDYLNSGQHTITYHLTVTTAGNFAAGYADATCMFCTEISAHSEGSRLNSK